MASSGADDNDDLSDYLDFSALPAIDLRYFTRSDLQSLSVASNSTLPNLNDLTNEIAVPKIDRTIFNESAGSRKQTFSRLRLTRRNQESDSISSMRKSNTRSEAVKSANDAEIGRVLKELLAEGSVEGQLPDAVVSGNANLKDGSDNDDDVVVVGCVDCCSGRNSKKT